MKEENAPGFIPPHGGYESLLSYQKALVVFEATVQDQQLKALEQAFLKEGGLREAMTRARMESRKNQRPNR